MTSVGVTAPAACAAIRAGISNPKETNFFDTAGERIVGHQVALEQPLFGRQKLVAMAAMRSDVSNIEGPETVILTCDTSPNRCAAPVVLAVLQQHADDAAMLHTTRTALTEAPHVKLHYIRRFDDRLAAHLDGLDVAGDAGWSMCQAQLETVTAGRVFTAGIQAIAGGSVGRLERLLPLAEAVPDAQVGLVSAFGWVEAAQLRGIVTKLLTSENAFRRQIGLAACAVHRVDPGTLERDTAHENPQLRVCALRTVGELGTVALLRSCIAMLRSDDSASAFWSAWSAVLLGDRARALAALVGAGRTPGMFRSPAFRLTMQLLNREAIREALLPLARDARSVRWAIMGAGISGDPSYVTWLIGLMRDDALCRPAGESFSLITGADLALLDLERKPPEGVETGPNDDPSDPNVDMDPDDGLPWPDQARVQAWWDSNGARFAAGTRYFVGEPLSREHCIEVLKSGYQRQRILAAHYLCLLEPGTVLFNTSAPAWRQQQQLAQMN